MITSARSRGRNSLQSVTAGTLTGVGVTIAVALVFGRLQPASLDEYVTAVSIGFALALAGCTVGTALYWTVRERSPEELDVAYVAAFGLSVGISVLVWKFAPHVGVFVDLVTTDPLGLPVGIFLLVLQFLGALAYGIPALVLGALAGTLSTAAVTYVYNGVAA